MKKFIILFFVLYFLCLFQTSFFNFLKVQPNFILVLFISLLIFEKDKKSGIFIAILGGLLLDIFSNFILGTNIITLISIYILMLIVMKYVREINFYLFPVFIIFGTIFFNLFLSITSFLLPKIFHQASILQFNLSSVLLFEMLYNLIFGAIVFYTLKIYRYKMSTVHTQQDTKYKIH